MNIFYKLFFLVFMFVSTYSEATNLSKQDTTMIKYKTITFDEADSLLKIQKGVLNNRLSRPGMSKVFNLKDSTMLVIGKKACFVYNSEEDIVRLLSGGVVSENILFDLNFFGKELPKKVEESRNKIAQLLKLDIGKLDYSEQSLTYIDHEIIASFIKGKITKTELLKNVIYFIAYSGNVFNLKYNGAWLMVLDEDGETWQPYNEINGRRIDLFTWIYSSLCDLNDGEIPSILTGYYSKTDNFLKNK